METDLSFHTNTAVAAWEPRCIGKIELKWNLDSSGRRCPVEMKGKVAN